MIMVGGISFISTTDDGGAAPADGEGGEIPGQSGASCVIPLIRAQPQTDDYRTLEELHEGFRVFDAQHNIIFLITYGILCYHEKFFQIIFCRL